MALSQDTILTIGMVGYAVLIGVGFALNATAHREWLRPTLKWLGGPLGWVLTMLVLGLAAAAGLLQEWLVVAVLWATLPTVLRWLLGSPAEKACVDVSDDPAPAAKKRRRKL